MNKLKFDYMNGLTHIKNMETIEEKVKSIGKDLIEEGFDEEDVCEFILIKVKQCLVSQVPNYKDLVQLERGEIK